MKKLLRNILLFLFILFIVDRVGGLVFGYLSSHPRGGMTLHRNYITDHTSEDILIFGSSRARYHYVPAVITDSTGLSCFNCGEDANGIILFYAWWNIINQRYHPKLLIYDIIPQYDILEGDNYKFLWRLRRFYDREGVRSLFKDVDPYEQWKMFSMLYRYNSTFTELIADYFHPLILTTKDGFVPCAGNVDKSRAGDKKRFEDTKLVFDSLKLAYLEKFIKEMKSTKLLIVASPIFEGMNSDVFEPVRRLCDRYDVPFIDYTNNPKYVKNSMYFRDLNHLNTKGAETFTSDLMHDLPENLKPSLKYHPN